MQTGPRQRIAALCGAALIANAVHGAPGDIIHRFDSPVVYGGDQFGWDVAAANNIIAINRLGPGDDPRFRGEIYLFNGDRSSAGFGDLLATIPDPDPSETQAIVDEIGLDDRVLVAGSQHDDTAGENAGAIWVFDAAPASATFGQPLLRIPSPEPEVEGRFGETLDVRDGLALVGAPCHTVGGMPEAGVAYLICVDPVDARFGEVLHAYRNPSPAEGDSFGNAPRFCGEDILVCFAGDDTDGMDTGSAYLYGGVPGSPQFGVLIHRFSNPEPGTGNLFAFPGAGACTPSIAAIGAPGDDFGAFDAGACFLFDIEPTSGTFGASLRKIMNPTPFFSDLFGYRLVGVGNSLLVGVPFAHYYDNDNGEAFVYDMLKQSPTFGQLLISIDNPTPNFSGLHGWFAYSVAAIGEDFLIGHPGYGDLYIGPVGRAWIFEGPVSLASATPSPPPTPVPTPTPTPTPICCPGDADNSGGFVNAADFLGVQLNFGFLGPAGSPGDADCTGGFVDAADFTGVQANFGRMC